MYDVPLPMEEDLETSQPSVKSRISYVAIPTDDPHKEHKARRKKLHEEGNWGVQLVDDFRVQNFVGLAIILNGIVIGLETDLPDYTNWNIVENGFLAFFIVEITFRMCVEKCQFFDGQHPDFLWNIFDCVVIGVGVIDLILSYSGTPIVGYGTLFRMVRLMRILRLLRLLKYMKRLYMLAMGLVEACKAIFWVTILMFLALYVCGVVLVKTIGRCHPSDPHYDFLVERFGSVSKAMLTLFTLISSPNLPIYQDETGLLESRPIFTLFLVFFITFGCFGLLGMLTGVINETMFENNELRREEAKLMHEDMRQQFAENCSGLFEDIPKNRQGEASIEDVKMLAPQTLDLLEGAGARIARGDILKFIDNIDVDDSGTISIVEFVAAMENVAEGINPLGVLAVEKAVGKCCRTLGLVEKKVVAVEEKVLMELRQVHDNWKLLRDEQKGGHLEVEQCISKCMDTRMQKLFTNLLFVKEEKEARVRTDITEQIGGMQREVAKSMQILSTQMDGSHNYVQSVVNQQTVDLRRSMQALLQQRETSGEALRSALAQQMCEEVKDEGEIGRCLLKLADQMDSTVSKQMGETRMSMRQLLGQKQDSAESLLSTVSAQVMELQNSMLKFMEQKKDSMLGVTAEQLADTDQVVQKVLEQWRVIGNEASLHGVVVRQTEQIHKSVQKFLDQKDSSEHQLQLAVSSQIQDIATAVQKLLQERDSRDTSVFSHATVQQQAVSQHIAEIRDSVQVLRHKEVRSGDSLELIVSQQVQDMKLSVQRQIDVVQASLLKSVAELGGAVLGGVADLLVKNPPLQPQSVRSVASTIQLECANTLQEQALASPPNRSC